MTDREMCAVFSKNLTNIMRDRKIKQADIVRTLHVAKATVSGWCSGLNIPRTDALGKLVQMLDVNLSDLLTEEKPTPVSEDGPLSPDRQYLIDAIRLMPDEGVRKLRVIVEQVIDERDR